MEGAFGHGLVKGRGGFPEKGLSRVRIFFLESGFKLLHHRLSAMQDRVVSRVTLLGLTGTFNGRFMDNRHKTPSLETPSPHGGRGLG